MARKPLEMNATLIRRIDLAEGLTIFRVRPEAHDFQTFEPGQYVVLGLNHPEHGPVQRSYSIASPPQTLPEYLDFYVRFVVRPTSENPLTHLLFKLTEGDRLFMGPKFRGKFTVASEVGTEDTRLRVLVAAGTGLAPFTSMVFDHIHRFGPTDQYLILHGASYPHDLGYREELEKALNTDPAKKRYFPTISRDPGNDEWPEDGFRGRVETFFEAEKLARLERAAGLPEGFLTPQNAVVFICGLTGTIANSLVLLLNRGFIPRELKLRNGLHIPAETPPSLFFEQYDTEPVLDVKNDEAMKPYRAQLEAAGVVLAPEVAGV